MHVLTGTVIVTHAACHNGVDLPHHLDGLLLSSVGQRRCRLPNGAFLASDGGSHSE